MSKFLTVVCVCGAYMCVYVFMCVYAYVSIQTRRLPQKLCTAQVHMELVPLSRSLSLSLCCMTHTHTHTHIHTHTNRSFINIAYMYVIVCVFWGVHAFTQ